MTLRVARALLASACLAAPASAQEIKLKLSHFTPVTHNHHVNVERDRAALHAPDGGSGLADAGRPLAEVLGALGVLWIILILYLILGCVMDELAIILLTVPIFFPVVMQLGFGSPQYASS